MSACAVASNTVVFWIIFLTKTITAKTISIVQVPTKSHLNDKNNEIRKKSLPESTNRMERLLHVCCQQLQGNEKPSRRRTHIPVAMTTTLQLKRRLIIPSCRLPLLKLWRRRVESFTPRSDSFSLLYYTTIFTTRIRTPTNNVWSRNISSAFPVPGFLLIFVLAVTWNLYVLIMCMCTCTCTRVRALKAHISRYKQCHSFLNHPTTTTCVYVQCSSLNPFSSKSSDRPVSKLLLFLINSKWSDATCVRSLDLNYEPITVCEHEELLAAYDCSETNVYVYRYVPYSTGSYDFMIEMGLVTYPFVVDMN